MKHYLVLIADTDEFNPFCNGLDGRVEDFKTYTVQKMPAADFTYKGLAVTTVCFGIGKVNAAQGAAAVLSKGSYDGVLNTGWSGAVSGVRKGDILVGDSCVECDFDMTPLGYKPGQKMNQVDYIYTCDSELAQRVRAVDGFCHGKLGTGDIFLTDPVRSAAYHETFGVNAFDMESAALCSACRLFDVPFVSVRKISDDANDASAVEYRGNRSTDLEAFPDIILAVLDNLC